MDEEWEKPPKPDAGVQDELERIRINLQLCLDTLLSLQQRLADKGH